MKITIIAIGKLSAIHLPLMNDYLKRINRFAKIDIVEIDQEYIKDENSTKEIAAALKQEGEYIAKRIKDEYVIVLDIAGENISSEQLADKINSCSKSIVFIIGSSHGLDEKIKQRADFIWSFSKLTFPHQLVRIMMSEQIYRALAIGKNHPYHK